MFELKNWMVRAFYLSCLILVPFLVFVVRRQYGFANLEACAAIALLAGASILLGWLARGKTYYALIAFCVTVMATYPLQVSVKSLSEVRPWICAAAIAALTLSLMRLMRAKFFPVMAVFVWSSLLVDIGISTVHGESHAPLRTPGDGEHVLWLILDEQIGLDGFPDFPKCDLARAHLEQTLLRHDFTVFRRAYSNYAVTVDSISSILNGRLVERSGELIRRVGTGQMRHYAIKTNRLIEDFRARGYRVFGYQPGALEWCANDHDATACQEYGDKLFWLHRAPGGWPERFRWLVGDYQSSDPWLLKVKGFFPFRFGLHMTGPLSVEGFWPDGLADEILGARERTLFLVHLLTPHSPYLYRRDGSIRPLEEWSKDRSDRRVDAEKYAELYCRYCEQVDFVGGQLDRLLQRLEEGGVMKKMTVIIHGDHGSRILRKRAGTSVAGGQPEDDDVMPDVCDYQGEPEIRDLLDRFSTLLAVKRKGATRPSVQAEEHSVLTGISEYVLGREPLDGAVRADKVYLVGDDGLMKPIDIQHYWR